jgi:NTP pyrophosphatase (non-canonical NTP hydrolase)
LFLKAREENMNNVELDLSNLKMIFEDLHFNNEIQPEQIPNLDLYMDQVITLFESNLFETKRSAEDKLLTKTMINNYTKDKLLMAAKKKKYTRDHVILMIIIYNLKQSLAINDIKNILKPIVEKIENNEQVDIDSLYNKYLLIKTNNSEEIKASAEQKLKEVKDEDGDVLLYILSIIDMANGYRKIAEKLIDKFFLDMNEK